MKRRFKQVLSMAAVTVLTTGCLAGCGSNSGGESTSAAGGGQSDASQTTDTTTTTESEAPEARQSVSIMGLTFNGNPIPDDNPLVTTLEDTVNYDINFTWILDADYKDKISTMIAGGTLPEITLLKSIDSNIIQNCRAGAFWDLTDYLDDYEYLSQISDVAKQNIAIDGRIYGIPRTRQLMRHVITYRQDWLDNLGLQPAATFEEFEKIIRAFTFDDPDKNGKNDTYGIVSTSASTGFDTVAMWFGAPNGWGEDADGSLQPAFLTDEYFQSMEWLRGLYKEGILNADFVTLPNSGAKDAFKSEQSGVFYSDAEGNAFATYFTSQGIDAKITSTAAFETAAGKVAPSADGYAGILAVSKASVKTEEDLKRCLTFLDRLNSPECQNMFQYVGLEGIDWQQNGDGTASRIGDGNVTIGEYDGFNQIMMNIGSLYYPEKPANEIAEQIAEAQKENLNYLVSNPGKALLRTSETYNSIGAQLDQLISDGRIQYIVGELDEAGWQNLLQDWRKQGGDAVIAEVNAVYAKTK